MKLKLFYKIWRKEVKYEDYKIAINNLRKMKDGLSKELLKVQLRKTAEKDLDDSDFNKFELLYDLTFDFCKIFPSSEMTSSVEDFV